MAWFVWHRSIKLFNHSFGHLVVFLVGFDTFCTYSTYVQNLCIISLHTLTIIHMSNNHHWRIEQSSRGRQHGQGQQRSHWNLQGMFNIHSISVPTYIYYLDLSRLTFGSTYLYFSVTLAATWIQIVQEKPWRQCTFERKILKFIYISRLILFIFDFCMVLNDIHMVLNLFI